MNGFTAFIAVLAMTPLWITVVHAMLTRLAVSRSSNQAAALLSCLVAAPPMAVALWAAHLGSLSGSELAAGLSYAVIVYGLLAYSYFHLFNMGETARRVRMLVELTEHGEMEAGELKSYYNTGTMLERRIERLISLGQLRLHGDRLVLGSRRLHFAAAVMNAWCSILGLPPLKGAGPRGR